MLLRTVGSSVRVFRQGHGRQRRHLMELHLPRTRGAAFPACLLLRCPQPHARGDTIDRAGSAEPGRAVGELGQRSAGDGCAAAPRLLRRPCVPLAREQPALRPQKRASGSARSVERACAKAAKGRGPCRCLRECWRCPAGRRTSRTCSGRAARRRTSRAARRRPLRRRPSPRRPRRLLWRWVVCRPSCRCLRRPSAAAARACPPPVSSSLPHPFFCVSTATRHAKCGAGYARGDVAGAKGKSKP